MRLVHGYKLCENNDYIRKRNSLGIVHDYCDCDCHKPCILKLAYTSNNICILLLSTFLKYHPETEETAVGSSLARFTCESSQVLLAGGQVVYLGDLQFSPDLAIDSAQNE